MDIGGRPLLNLFAALRKTFFKPNRATEINPDPPRISGENIYHWKVVDVGDIVDFPNGIADIYDRKIDGFLIRGVLDPEEIQCLLDGLDETAPNELTVLPNGITLYPESFSQQDQKVGDPSENLRAYFQACALFRQRFLKRFGVSVEQRLQTVFDALAGGRRSNVPQGFGGVGSFAPCSFRRLTSGLGRFNDHCGNLFHAEFPKFYEKLSPLVKIHDQLSFFVVLQQAQQGGELILFDALWDHVKIRSDGDAAHLLGEDGRTYELNDPSKVRRQLINPKPGDLIIFGGGHIWHRVETVEGPRDRITLGGFLANSNDDQSIYFWT